MTQPAIEVVPEQPSSVNSSARANSQAWYRPTLAAPLAYAATTGTIATGAMGLWVLNTLYFSSTIFTIKLRKPKTSSVIPGLGYHAIATLIIAILYYLGWLPLVAALAFGLALLKFGIAALNQQWYRTAKIQWVATIGVD